MRLRNYYIEDREKAVQEGVERGIQQGVQRGIQQGVQRGIQKMIENMLLARFGTIDPELETIIPSLLAFPSEEITPLLFQLSRSELLERFQDNN